MSEDVKVGDVYLFKLAGALFHAKDFYSGGWTWEPLPDAPAPRACAFCRKPAMDARASDTRQERWPVGVAWGCVPCNAMSRDGETWYRPDEQPAKLTVPRVVKSFADLKLRILADGMTWVCPDRQPAAALMPAVAKPCPTHNMPLPCRDCALNERHSSNRKYMVHIGAQAGRAICGNECFLNVKPGDVYHHEAGGGAAIFQNRGRRTPAEVLALGLADYEEWCPMCWRDHRESRALLPTLRPWVMLEGVQGPGWDRRGGR